MPRKKKKIKAMKGRPRGGASIPCPECEADSHVIITRREGSVVVRKRECKGRTPHVFETREETL